MMSEQETGGESLPKITESGVAGMTVERRYMLMRVLWTRRAMLERDTKAEVKALVAELRSKEADFEATIKNPIDLTAHAEVARRFKKLQGLDEDKDVIEAKIDNAKALGKERVAKLDKSFERLLFPKRKATTQTDLFPEQPAPIEPETIEVIQDAVAAAAAEVERRAAVVADAPAEGGEAVEPEDDDGIVLESAEDLAALQRELEAYATSLGVANMAAIDEASEASAEVVDIGTRKPPKKAGGRGRKRDDVH